MFQAVLLAGAGRRVGLNIGSVRVSLSAGAVHGVYSLGYNHDERRAHKNARAEESDKAELPLRQAQREREDAGNEGAGGSQRSATSAQTIVYTHATAMMALKVSNMKSPSHMVRWLSRGLATNAEESVAPNIYNREERDHVEINHLSSYIDAGEGGPALAGVGDGGWESEGIADGG